MNVINIFNRIEEKNHVITIDMENAFDRIQHIFIIKTLRKLRIERNFLKVIRNTYEQLPANIILNGEMLNSFSLRLGARGGCLNSPLLSNTVLEVLPSAIVSICK